MAQYYALVAGLPILVPDTQRLPLSQVEYYGELRKVLSRRDLVLLESLRLEPTNEILLKWVLGVVPSKEWNEDLLEGSGLPIDELRTVVLASLSGSRRPKPRVLRDYMSRFVYEYFRSYSSQEVVSDGFHIVAENHLSLLYYQEMEQSSSVFVSSWFHFNRLLRNVLSVFTCRRIGWQPEEFVVGAGEEEHLLCFSKARDFELSEQEPYIVDMVQIAEERDIAKRERLIDLLKWRWLDEKTFAKVFDIDNVLAYYIRLGIVERWHLLNAERGEETFRSIVSDLRKASNVSLQEFRQRSHTH